MRRSALLICLLIGICFIPASVEAVALTISPLVLSEEISPGVSKDLEFTISGFDGILNINSENLPITLSPLQMTVTNGSKIKITLKCNDVVSPSIRLGDIIFFAKDSAGRITNLVRVKCKLTIVLSKNSLGSSSSCVPCSASSSSSAVKTPTTKITSESLILSKPASKIITSEPRTIVIPPKSEDIQFVAIAINVIRDYAFWIAFIVLVIFVVGGVLVYLKLNKKRKTNKN